MIFVLITNIVIFESLLNDKRQNYVTLVCHLLNLFAFVWEKKQAVQSC